MQDLIIYYMTGTDSTDRIKMGNWKAVKKPSKGSFDDIIDGPQCLLGYMDKLSVSHILNFLKIYNLMDKKSCNDENTGQLLNSPGLL